MSKSFHSVLNDALDDSHQNGKLATRDHYALKRAMREATMRGKTFKTAEEIATYIVEGRRYQK